MSVRRTVLALAALAFTTVTGLQIASRPVEAQGGLTPASARAAGDGQGPFRTLTIRGVMLIDGTGAPPAGPMNITVEGNRITRVSSAGTPGVPTRGGGQGRGGGRGAAASAP